MQTTMSWKGYIATIEYDPDIRKFHGIVQNANSVITFYGSSVDERIPANLPRLFTIPALTGFSWIYRTSSRRYSSSWHSIDLLAPLNLNGII